MIPRIHMGKKQAAGGGTDWTPSNSSNLYGWWDAGTSDNFTFSSGSLASQWDDLSTVGAHFTQATTSNQPTHNNTTLNSLPVLSGLSDDEMGVDPYDEFDGLSTFCVATIFKSSDTTLLNRDAILGYLADDADNDDYWRFLGFADTDDDAFDVRIWLDGGGGTVVTLDGTNSTGWLGNWHLYLLDVNGNTVTYRQDGSQVGTNSSASNSFDGGLGVLNLGENGDRAPSTWDVAEIVICDRADIEKVEGYLAHRWGLEGNLPAGHTYKSSPPTV